MARLARREILTFYALRFTDLKGAILHRDRHQATERVVPLAPGMAEAVYPSRVVSGFVGPGHIPGLQVWLERAFCGAVCVSNSRLV
jgi:hypothetical protein